MGSGRGNIDHLLPRIFERGALFFFGAGAAFRHTASTAFDSHFNGEVAAWPGYHDVTKGKLAVAHQLYTSEKSSR